MKTEPLRGHGEKRTLFTCSRDDFTCTPDKYTCTRNNYHVRPWNIISPFAPYMYMHKCVPPVCVHVVQHSQRNTSLGHPRSSCVEINKLLQDGRIFKNDVFRRSLIYSLIYIEMYNATVVSQPLFMSLFRFRVIIGNVGDSPKKGWRSRGGRQLGLSR